MISFVGAGPGAADLVTVRGARLLAQADVVVYAGSLVNPELLDLCGEGCQTYDSAVMTLEQVVGVMADAERAGRRCVRLHTGDPALFGAIREQMDALAALGLDFEVVPGVSSMFGASAVLRAEYTVPGVSQSVIVCRMEGRTPVPERERLRKLAPHGCTMVLFLSASLLREVQEELLAGGYDPATPAAIVVRATWPDEEVHRCTVGTIARCGEDHAVSRTALVVVGNVLGDAGKRSCLYDPTFSHGYRGAVDMGDAAKTAGASDVAPRKAGK